MNIEENSDDLLKKRILVFSIFVAGLCSIIYELLISTTSTYLLGDSIKQFSITIGVYMAAMGLGSYMSRLFKENLIQSFIITEIFLALVGGISVPLLYLVYVYTDTWGFSFMMILMITLIGVLTGLEIPLITRIMKKYYPLKINLSNVLSLDYAGALIATLLFPFVLLPWLGTFKSSLIFGMVNLGIGFLNFWIFAEETKWKRKQIIQAAMLCVFVFFVFLLLSAQVFLAEWNDRIYKNPVIYSEQSPYQHIVLTKGKENVNMYIDRVIQWSSADEYRYHESLVHIPMGSRQNIKSVLILGGGEGLALREVLKYKELDTIVIVDLDPAVFNLAQTNPLLKEINNNSLAHPKVKMISEDAFTFLKNNNTKFDFILSDLPDPVNETIARLYSDLFFKLCYRNLSENGCLVSQATSPFYTPRSFWCIFETIKSIGFEKVRPYHALVPSFGDWGFVFAEKKETAFKNFIFPTGLKFIDSTTLQSLFYFPIDQQPINLDVNTLDHPILFQYHHKDWSNWNYSENTL
jgi:spermidine synthase